MAAELQVKSEALVRLEAAAQEAAEEASGLRAQGQEGALEGARLRQALQSAEEQLEKQRLLLAEAEERGRGQHPPQRSAISSCAVTPTHPAPFAWLRCAPPFAWCLHAPFGSPGRPCLRRWCPVERDARMGGWIFLASEV